MRFPSEKCLSPSREKRDRSTGPGHRHQSAAGSCEGPVGQLAADTHSQVHRDQQRRLQLVRQELERLAGVVVEFRPIQDEEGQDEEFERVLDDDLYDDQPAHEELPILPLQEGGTEVAQTAPAKVQQV